MDIYALDSGSRVLGWSHINLHAQTPFASIFFDGCFLTHTVLHFTVSEVRIGQALLTVKEKLRGARRISILDELCPSFQATVDTALI